MQHDQFEDLLTRAAKICSRNEWTIFGSQAVHALTPSPPAEVLVSVECDLWLQDEPDVAGLISAELGKDSSFAKTTGIYADLLPPDLPVVPVGWQERLVAHRMGDVTARCLEVHDLIISKLAAGRLKDYEFVAALILAKLARGEELQRRICTFTDPHMQAVLLARLRVATEASDTAL